MTNPRERAERLLDDPYANAVVAEKLARDLEQMDDNEYNDQASFPSDGPSSARAGGGPIVLWNQGRNTSNTMAEAIVVGVCIVGVAVVAVIAWATVRIRLLCCVE